MNLGVWKKRINRRIKNRFKIFGNIKLSKILPMTPILAFPVLLFNSIDPELIFDIIRAN